MSSTGQGGLLPVGPVKGAAAQNSPSAGAAQRGPVASYARSLGDRKGLFVQGIQPNSCGSLDCLSLCHARQCLNVQCLNVQQYTEQLLCECNHVECVP